MWLSVAPYQSGVSPIFLISLMLINDQSTRMYTWPLLALTVLIQRVFKLNLIYSYACDSSLTSDPLPSANLGLMRTAILEKVL